jgi:hypothetical protein
MVNKSKSAVKVYSTDKKMIKINKNRQFEINLTKTKQLCNKQH